jgi:hypothetical protein
VDRGSLRADDVDRDALEVRALRSRLDTGDSELTGDVLGSEPAASRRRCATLQEIRRQEAEVAIDLGRCDGAHTRALRVRASGNDERAEDE